MELESISADAFIAAKKKEADRPATLQVIYGYAKPSDDAKTIEFKSHRESKDWVKLPLQTIESVTRLGARHIATAECELVGISIKRPSDEHETAVWSLLQHFALAKSECLKSFLASLTQSECVSCKADDADNKDRPERPESVVCWCRIVVRDTVSGRIGVGEGGGFGRQGHAMMQASRQAALNAVRNAGPGVDSWNCQIIDRDGECM